MFFVQTIIDIQNKYDYGDKENPRTEDFHIIIYIIMCVVFYMMHGFMFIYFVYAEKCRRRKMDISEASSQ